MTTVWLVRHASTAWTGRRWCGSTDLALSATGRMEAAVLAEGLSDAVVEVADVISSPARRATETAEPIGRAAGRPVRIDARLREVDLGRIEGLSWQQIEQRSPDLAEAILAGHPLVDWPGGETAQQVATRAAWMWSDLRSARGSLIVITHGGLIRALLAHVTGDHGFGTSIGPASITEISKDVDGWAVRTR